MSQTTQSGPAGGRAVIVAVLVLVVIALLFGLFWWWTGQEPEQAANPPRQKTTARPANPCRALGVERLEQLVPGSHFERYEDSGAGGQLWLVGCELEGGDTGASAIVNVVRYRNASTGDARKFAANAVRKACSEGPGGDEEEVDRFDTSDIGDRTCGLITESKTTMTNRTRIRVALDVHRGVDQMSIVYTETPGSKSTTLEATQRLARELVTRIK